mgnify:CR=1 FL=1
MSTAQALATVSDSHVIAFALRQGKTPAQVAKERGWNRTRLERAVACLSRSVVNRYGLVAPEDVFNSFVVKMEEQVQDLLKIKAMFQEGVPHHITQTVTTTVPGENGKPQRATVVHTTPARNGVTAGDVIRCIDMIINTAKNTIEVGQTLGVIAQAAPKEEQGVKVLHIHQTLINAVKSGDWEAVRNIRDGKVVPPSLGGDTISPSNVVLEGTQNFLPAPDLPAPPSVIPDAPPTFFPALPTRRRRDPVAPRYPKGEKLREALES